MRKRVLITSALLIAAACTSKPDSMSEELRKDLDVAASSDGLALPDSRRGTQQVVSAMEQAPRAPTKIAASQRAIRHRRAESVSAPVETETAELSQETEPQAVSEAQVAADEAPPVAPRPVAVSVSYPGGNGGGRIGSGVGVDVGIGVGTMIGSILRGGAGGEDHCEIHDRRSGRRPIIGINTRIPVIRGTFPTN